MIKKYSDVFLDAIAGVEGHRHPVCINRDHSNQLLANGATQLNVFGKSAQFDIHARQLIERANQSTWRFDCGSFQKESIVLVLKRFASIYPELPTSLMASAYVSSVSRELNTLRIERQKKLDCSRKSFDQIDYSVKSIGQVNLIPMGTNTYTFKVCGASDLPVATFIFPLNHFSWYQPDKNNCSPRFINFSRVELGFWGRTGQPALRRHQECIGVVPDSCEYSSNLFQRRYPAQDNFIVCPREGLSLIKTLNATVFVPANYFAKGLPYHGLSLGLWLYFTPYDGKLTHAAIWQGKPDTDIIAHGYDYRFDMLNYVKQEYLNDTVYFI